MQQILGDDQSDESNQARIYCLAAMPDPQSKLDAWKKITGIDQDAKLSKKEMEQVIGGFNSQTD